MAEIEKSYNVASVKKLAKIVVDSSIEYSVNHVDRPDMPLRSAYLMTCVYCGHNSIDGQEYVNHDENCAVVVAKKILEE